ncbi:MAG TPA: hypothetical protein VNI52_10860 [Sphingobacteriaceae bacterium]|nr:hypothetical protein [Sphingobacteriaceae bacterium]
MANRGRNITISVLYGGELYSLETYINEYRNLMMLLFDRIGPEGFGDCLGMGKCATCLISIDGNKSKLTSYDRNEETTIAKAGITDKNVRLSCQILIDEGIDGLELSIL